MKVTLQDIRNIKPGEAKAFPCENAKSMFSACSLASYLRRTGLPSGISRYETRKDYDTNIVMIRAIANN